MQWKIFRKRRTFKCSFKNKKTILKKKKGDEGTINSFTLSVVWNRKKRKKFLDKQTWNTACVWKLPNDTQSVKIYFFRTQCMMTDYSFAVFPCDRYSQPASQKARLKQRTWTPRGCCEIESNTQPSALRKARAPAPALPTYVISGVSGGEGKRGTFQLFASRARLVSTRARSGAACRIPLPRTSARPAVSGDFWRRKKKRKKVCTLCAQNSAAELLHWVGSI